MSTKQVQDGDILEFTAPSGGVTTGVGVLIGSLFVVPIVSAAQTLPFNGCTEGVFTLPKTSAQAWTEGQRIYWDDSNHRCDSSAAVGQFIGVATAVAANPSSTGTVKLLGNAPDLSGAVEVAAIADLTMGTNVTAATANGSLEDSAATNPSDTNFNNNMKELGTKVNLILAALRTKGIIAT